MLRKLTLSVLALIAVAVSAGPAAAQENAGARGLGVGAMFFLDGPGGIQVAYDAGPWHLDGMFGVADRANTAVTLGARFWYHLHATQASDFSVGAGVAYLNNGSDNNDNDDFITIEGGALVRAFIVPNVALFGSVGLAVTTGDGDAFLLGGQTVAGNTLGANGGLGITYFFR